MPSSVKLDEIQRERIQRVIKVHVKRKGDESLINNPADSLMYQLATLFTEREVRYFDKSVNVMVLCLKEYFREKEASGELEAVPMGDGGAVRYLFVGKLKGDQPRRASGSNNGSRSRVVRPTHHIANGAAAPA